MDARGNVYVCLDMQTWQTYVQILRKLFDNIVSCSPLDNGSIADPSAEVSVSHCKQPEC